MSDLKTYIREIPDFPRPGINFYDITTLLQNAEGFGKTIDALVAQIAGEEIDMVVGIESRGFIFGAPVAARIGAGFVPVRKPNKLPGETVSVSYDLEYGQDTLEMHTDAIGSGHRVLIVDDLLATGGTARATADLITKVGGTIVKLLFVIELEALQGRQKLKGYEIGSLMKYAD